MNYIVHYDICALILYAVTAVVFCIRKRVPCRRNKVFGFMLGTAAASCVFDLLCVFTTSEMVGRFVKMFCHVSYYVTHNLITFAFMIYVLFLTDNFSDITKGFKAALYVPISVDIILILTSPLTKWIIYLDDNGVYTRGPLQPVCYVISVYYLLFGVVYTLRNRRMISTQVVVSITGFVGMTCVAVVIQLFNPHLLVECFGGALCIMLVMFMLQNQDDMIDSVTKMLNRSTFANNCMINFSAENPFSVLLIRIPDFTLLMKTFGGRFSNNLLRSFSEYLYSFVNLGDGYYLEDECFALTFFKDYDRIGRIYREIDARLSSNWKIGTVDTVISALFLRIDCPADASDVETVMDYIEQFKQYSFSDKKFYRTDDINLYDRKRRIDVERAIENALTNKNFKVYYQPVFGSEENRIVSCEALLRLIDDELGNIPPNEFIPIAEQNGSIMKIGKFVFEEACRFIRKGNAAALGIEYVQVNLSVVQCMQSDLTENFVNIMDRYKIDPSQICLEITETAVAYTPHIMEQNIKQLSMIGIKFALDDYGTGYSNMNYLLNLPFKYVKLEKEIICKAFNNEKARIAIESTIAMIKKLNMKIVAEGAETAEQVETLFEMKCDYIQGIYFSEPLAEKEFLKAAESFSIVKSKI